MTVLNRKQLLWATVVLLVVIFLQIVNIVNKGIITWDEGVSYIAATGHQGNYENQNIEGKWVNITEWKKLWMPDKKMCFGTISKDLAEYDIHPPLYFWLLHVWLLLTGTSIWSGAFLNLFFLAGIFFGLIAAGMKVINSFRFSLGMAFIWGISPAVMAYMKESRQYALLALFTVIFLNLLLDLLRKDHKFSITGFIPITITAAAGTLTHYYFVLLIAAASFVVLWKCYSSGKWELFKKFVVSMMASVILFISAHPNFYLSFIRQQGQAQDFVASDLLHRITLSVKAFVTYYFYGVFSKPGFVLIILLICILAVLLIIRPGLRLNILLKLTYIQRVVLFLFIFISAAFVGLYLSFISPAHSIIAKYLSMIHIFIVLSSFIIILQFSDKYQKILVSLLCLWQFSMGIYFIQKEHRQYAEYKQQPDIELFEIQNLVIDMPGRTVVPSILWYFPDNTNVYIADQDSLLASPHKWISQLGNEFLYISDVRPDNTIEKRQQLVEKIENIGYHLRKSDIFFYNKVSTYYSFLR